MYAAAACLSLLLGHCLAQVLTVLNVSVNLATSLPTSFQTNLDGSTGAFQFNGGLNIFAGADCKNGTNTYIGIYDSTGQSLANQTLIWSTNSNYYKMVSMKDPLLVYVSSYYVNKLSIQNSLGV